LRLRYLIKNNGSHSQLVAEECLIIGFKGDIGSEDWLSKDEAESLFKSVRPTTNVAESNQKYWIESVLNEFDTLKDKFDRLAFTRAENLLQSYEHVRKTMRMRKVNIEPLLPVDILSLSVILPPPRFQLF